MAKEKMMDTIVRRWQDLSVVRRDPNPFVQMALDQGERMLKEFRPPVNRAETDAIWEFLCFLTYAEFACLCETSAHALANFKDELSFQDRVRICEHITVEVGHTRFWRYKAIALNGKDPLKFMNPEIPRIYDEFMEIAKRDLVGYLVAIGNVFEVYGWPLFVKQFTWKVCDPELAQWHVYGHMPGEHDHLYFFVGLLKRKLMATPEEERQALIEKIARDEHIVMSNPKFYAFMGPIFEMLQADFNGMDDLFSDARTYLYERLLGIEVPQLLKASEETRF